MTQYLLAVYGTEAETYSSPEEMEKAFAQVDAFNQDLRASGSWVFAGGLHPPATATVVRMVDGEPLLTDGPFAESKEQLGGFWVITAEDLDSALKWAELATVACMNPVEVRPFADED